MSLLAALRIRPNSKVRTPRTIGIAVVGVLALSLLTGCAVQAGSALVLDGATISEQSVQQSTAAFLTENTPTTPPTDADRAGLNRRQITYLVRHALIAKAAVAQHMTITTDQINAVKASVAQQSPHGSVAAGLELPASDEAGVLRDLVVLLSMAQALPAAGVAVQNVSVTAEGVQATTRDEAVALRSKFLANPNDLDAAVASNAKSLAKSPFSLIQNPGVGSVGLYQATSDRVVIVPNPPAYLVLRATGRTVATTPLTKAAFSAVLQPGQSGQAPSLSGFLDLGALLVSKYQPSTSIAVNPRYGVWDPASLQVVPGNDGL